MSAFHQTYQVYETPGKVFPLIPNQPSTQGRSRSSVLLAHFQHSFRQVPVWLVITKLFFGLGWLRAAGAKVSSDAWWSGEELRDFVSSNSTATLPWFTPILTHLVLPLAAVLAVLVFAAQVAVGLALIVNYWVTPALTLAFAMNLTFIAVGAVNPSAFYLLGQGAIALWLLGNSPITPLKNRILHLCVGLAVVLMALSLPCIATLHPAHVIDDPAIVLVLLSGLTVLAVGLTRAHRADPLPPPTLQSNRISQFR